MTHIKKILSFLLVISILISAIFVQFSFSVSAATRKGTVIADNKTVCTISVIHSQIEDPDQIVEVLSKELDLSEEYVRKRVEKYSSIEKIESNVEKEKGDAIRAYNLAGVKVDEDYKRYYPYGNLASKVLGFTGGDNQGIIGLEVEYEDVLTGTPGKILTLTDARGVELSDTGESRLEPVAGNDLIISNALSMQIFLIEAEQSGLAASANAGNHFDDLLIFPFQQLLFLTPLDFP